MIELKKLCKVYKTADKEIVALDNIDLCIEDGEIFGIIGLSGAGKSTLVRCINLLEMPTDGEVIIDGQSLTKLPRNELLKLRHPELQFSLHISRIYRDARRLFGRGPFKDHLWFSIGYTVEGWHAGPMFWFEIGASEYSYGVGFFDATPAQMEAFRRSIDANPARFERIAKNVEALGNFRVFGPEYKRPKGDLGETLNLWYNRKRVGVECCRDFGEELYEAGLPETLASEFEKLMELYDYFLECYYAAPDGGK